MRIKLAKLLLRLALRALGAGRTDRKPMDDATLAHALCVEADHLQFRACMEVLRRYQTNAQREGYAERNVARNPNKAIFYLASAGTALDLCELLEAAREAAMSGHKLPI